MKNKDGDVHKDKEIIQILKDIIKNLDELGYDAVKQMVGYLQSGDLGYISNHNKSRNMISEIDRNEILEVLIKNIL